MAIYNQIGSYAVTGGDIPFKNATGSDIAAGIAVVMDTTAGRVMHVKPPAAAGSVAGSIGITVEAIANGKVGRVRCVGAAVATAHGTINPGEGVQIENASGHEGKVIVCGAATTQLGRALTAAVDGDQVLVLVGVATNA